MFGLIFLVNNALTKKTNQYLSRHGFSVVQWLLCAALSKQSGNSANLSQVATQLCTSRQNIKQIAQELVIKGWLLIGKDPQDSRAVRLSLTPECLAFWQEQDPANAEFLSELFGVIGNDELKATTTAMNRLYQHIIDSKGDKQ